MKYLLFSCAFFLFVACANKPASFPNLDKNYTGTMFPKPVGYVNDFDSIFSDSEEKNLLYLIEKHLEETTNAIGVVTINNIGNYDNIQKYSFDLANYWGLGQTEKDNGILLTIHVNAREIWIQNGTGIMDKLTDAETKNIISSVMIPEFKKNDYYTGTYNGIKAIIAELESENP